MNDPAEIFKTIKKEHFKELLEIAKKYKSDIDVDVLADDFFSDNRLMPALYERWYKSLDAHEKGYDYDYGVYDDDVYLIELFNCWKNCTRRTVKDTKRIVTKFPNIFNGVKNIFDLGCGIAYTTVALSSIFPESNIIGTNLHNTLQYKICEEVCAKYSRCYMIPEIDTLKQDCSIDMVCAFEFFEHLEEPLNLLKGLIETYNPKIILFANSFTHMSLGHFRGYTVENTTISGLEMNKAFYAVLKRGGYEKIKTKIYGDRPQVWVKDNCSKSTLF